MISLRSLMNLGLSLVALVFVTWIMLVHPDHQKLFGPAPGSQVKVAAAHAPPTKPPFRG
jgi:hypothetical protein